MDLDKRQVAGKLNYAEKKRRREKNLCMYCGQPGHYANECPEKASSGPNGREPKKTWKKQGPERKSKAINIDHASLS